MARLVWIVGPPHGRLVGHHIESGDDVGQREADIQIQLTAVDLRPRAIDHLPILLILIEAQVYRGADERTGLRHSDRDHFADRIGDRVGRAVAVRARMVEERDDVAGCRIADAEHERILRREYHFVQQIGVEAVAQADTRRIGSAGEGHRAAVRPGPVRAGNEGLGAVDAGDGL